MGRAPEIAGMGDGFARGRQPRSDHSELRSGAIQSSHARTGMGEMFRPGGGYGRIEVLSAVGKSAGTAWVTLPVAAHSVPRWSVTM
jgi:hypothetical protein